MPFSGVIKRIYKAGTTLLKGPGNLPWEKVKAKILLIDAKATEGYPAFTQIYQNPILDSPTGLDNVKPGRLFMCIRHNFCPADQFAREHPLYEVIYQTLQRVIYGQKEASLTHTIQMCMEVYNRTYPKVPVTKWDIARQSNCITVDFHVTGIEPPLQYSFCVRGDISILNNGSSVRENNCNMITKYELETATINLKFYGYPYYATLFGKEWHFEADGNACVGGFLLL